MQHKLDVHLILFGTQRPQRIGAHHRALIFRYRHIVAIPVVAVFQTQDLPRFGREQQFDALIRRLQLHAVDVRSFENAAQ
ncbi:hypothetical protein D3C80_1522370 [compost metagenome]